MARKDISSLVEQLEAFEKKLKVRIEAVSAFEEDEEDEEEDDEGDGESDITVRGELHPVNGTEISQDIAIRLSVYDAAGRLIETCEDFVDAESFFGFHTFELNCVTEAGSAKRLKLFPVLPG